MITVPAVAADGRRATARTGRAWWISPRQSAPGGAPGAAVRAGVCGLAVPGGYEGRCGTSMAAPPVAQVAALPFSRHPDASPAAGVRSKLRAQARPLPAARSTTSTWTGRRTPDARCRLCRQPVVQRLLRRGSGRRVLGGTRLNRAGTPTPITRPGQPDQPWASTTTIA
ncbi:S8 family serine peptidase [Actinoalloteichus hoggarensis]|uniref:S8 family serine peptidase n=1 Tax=Actinoalloteichus hoggarensis TaxID=1470176 RepID=UPI0012FE0710